MKKIFTFILALVASVGISSAAITVRLDPNSCSSWSTVRLWAWTDEGNVFDSWPGQIVSKDGDGWYAYTFSSSISSVNIIWTNGTAQTVDITGVTSSTCYKLNSQTGTTIKVSVVSCGSEGGQGGTPVSGKYKIGDLYYNLSKNQTAEVTYEFSGTSSNYQGLTTANIPSSVTYSGTTYSVTSIGNNAFDRCSSLISVTIPNSVTSIGSYALSRCSGLTSVTIGNSVTSIGNSAFYKCSSLTSVTIPNSVTSIGDRAFDDCSSLPVINNLRYADTYLVEAVDRTRSTYTIKDGTRWIGNSAFSGCSGLTSVTIPNSVTSIGSGAFYGCSSLTSVTIPNSVTSIGSSAFYGCSSLTSVTIPNSVTSIGSYAFCNCSGLTSVTIPNSVTSIGIYAFYNCSGLTSVTIPNSVTSIEACTFRDFSSLSSVTIPNSVTSIVRSAFDGCSSLPVINNLRYADTYLLEAVDRTRSTYTIKDGTRWIGAHAFEDCSSLTSVTIPNSVTSIGGDAFSGCSSLTSVTIPNSVTSIGYEAFYKCSSLTSVTIGNSVTSIGDRAFYFCSSLPSVTIPNSVTSIGHYAFNGCSGLTSVTIPNSVTSIGSSAFSGCSGLTAIYVPCGEMERFKQMLNNDSRINDHSPLPYTITINATNGSVAYPQTMCDDMQLIATPYNGYHFVKWSDGNTDNPRTFELTRDTTFTALFAPNQCTVSLQCDDNQGSVEGAGVFDYLTEVQISATPAYGYHFTFWSDGNTANPRTITVTKDVALTANFAINKYALNVSCNAEQGSVTGSGSYNYLSNRTIEATSNYGYHFTKWSDGNTDNPRTIELRQNTTLEAIFAVDKYGTCGDNLQLTWRYDTGSQTLTISGEGDLTTNMRYGVEAVKEMKELVIEDGVGVIGNEACANIKTLNTITLGKDVRKLQERVFYNCYNLTAIYNYRKTPASATSNTFEEVDKYACTIYVLAGSEEMFRSATGWKDFYSILAIGATETTVSDNKVSVEPSDNSATVTWPVSNEAASYTIDITKDGVVFCRLTFNANGQLTGIAFAPGRDGQSMASAAVMTANGLQFTVTGLNSNTQYGYNLTAKDANEQPIATYSGSFTTTSEGVPTGIGNTAVEQKTTKILHNGEVLIMRGGKIYNLQGVEVK